MQTSDNHESSADPEFREPGIDAEGDSAKPSKGDARSGRKVPKNKDAAQAAVGVSSGPTGSSPPETNLKQSEVDEPEKLENGRNPSQRSPAINPGGDGKAELSDQLKSPIGYQTQEQVGRQADHSGRSTSGDDCKEPGKAPVQAIDARNSLTERAETDQDSETLAAVSSALSDIGADTAIVRKKNGTSNAANGASKEPSSPGSAHQEPLAHEEAGKFEDRTEDDDFAAIQSLGASIEATDEDDRCVSVDFRSHSSPGADARNSDVAEEPPKTREPAGALAGDNSRRGRRIAARILAVGTLASACIFASEQFGATAWLIETAQIIQAQYSLPLPNSSVRPEDGLGSSIELIGGGEGRAVAFESDSNRESANDLDPALPIDDGIGSAPATDRLTGNADRSAEYSAIPDGEVAPMSLAGRSNSERTDTSILESSKIDGGRRAPSDNQSPDGASGTATIEAEPELVSSGAENAEDIRAFELDAAVIERNRYDATQLQAASVFSSSVARPPDEQVLSETADDIEEGLVGPLKVGSLRNVSDYGRSGKPTGSAQQSAFSEGNQSIPSKYSASPLSDEIASFDFIPDAAGEPANAAVNSSILDKWDGPSPADLNSLRSEFDSEFAKINSRLDLMYERFDLLIAGHEPGSAFLGESKVSDAPVFESQNDTNVASDVNCQHSAGRSGQNCEASSRADKGSQPYLIATAEHAADGEFVMPEQGYGVVLDVLKDGAGGWLLVMENATLRLD